MKEDTLAQELLRIGEQLRGSRGNWESHWEEIASRVIPEISTLFNSRGTVVGGEKRTRELFDATAAMGLHRFASALDWMVTPRENTWHGLRATNKQLMKDKSVIKYFEEVTDCLFYYRYAAQANFSSQIQEVYTSLGAFGTAPLYVDHMIGRDGKRNGIRYKSVFLGEVYFLENHQGIVDTVYRFFMLKPRQMVQKWGDKVPKSIQDKIDKDCDIEVMQCIRPNNEKIVGRLDFKGKDFYSAYVCKEGNAVLHQGGYDSFPFMVPRYMTTPGEVYGRSPAMLVLPSIKTLNEEKRIVLKQGQRIVDPVLLAHDDGVLNSFSLKSGAINYGGVNADGRLLVQPLPTGNINVAKDLMDDERQIINDAFLVTLFQILIETPTMTATEVIERTKEKGALLAPTMGRLQGELLAPMIERELDILARQRKLPEMPGVLREAGGEYTIEYDSPLARAQKAETTAGTMRTLQWTAEVAAASQRPDLFDHYNFDEIMPALAWANGMPAKYMNDKDTIAKLRDDRQQQAATQQLVDAAPAIASLAKNGASAQ